MNEDNCEGSVLRRRAFDSVKRSKSDKKVYIECHRGLHKEEPENTLSAFSKAIELKYDSIELDIWLTLDYIPVVIHGNDDGLITCISKKSKKVNEMTYREVRDFLVNEKNEPIPALEDVFVLCKNKIFLNIEIKDFNYSLTFQKIHELISKYDMKQQIAISSFKHEYWEEIKKLDEIDNIEFGFLYDTTDNKKINFDLDKPNSTINVWYKEINPDFVRQFHEKSIGVHVWFCMNDIESDDVLHYLINCGVDVICSNTPDKALMMREAIQI